MSTPITQVSGRAYPWGAKNIDTDIIIPAHWLKTTTREGLGKGAFESIRAQPGNIFDDPRYTGSPVLIAPSFSDIFSGNAFKNGIVPVVLPQAAVDRLIAAAQDGEVTVDLETMTVTTSYQDRFPFELDAFRRDCLMQGLDEIGLTLAQDTAISKFESADDQYRPWISGRASYEGIAV